MLNGAILEHPFLFQFTSETLCQPLPTSAKVQILDLSGSYLAQYKSSQMAGTGETLNDAHC